jgi:hypothetical protein
VLTIYRKKLLQRARHILWGPIEVAAAVLGLLVLLSRPVMDYLLKLWEGLPWWVGALLLGALLLYALLRAGYELWKEEEQARRKAERERDELKQEDEELIAGSENRANPLPDTLTEWLGTTPLFTVANRTFRNDRIELDGFHYVNCVFDSCTFSFRGTKPFRVAETCRIEGGYSIDATRAPQALAILVFLKSLDALGPDTEYRDPIDGGLVD